MMTRSGLRATMDSGDEISTRFLTAAALSAVMDRTGSSPQADRAVIRLASTRSRSISPAQTVVEMIDWGAAANVTLVPVASTSSTGKPVVASVVVVAAAVVSAAVAAVVADVAAVDWHAVSGKSSRADKARTRIKRAFCLSMCLVLLHVSEPRARFPCPVRFKSSGTWIPEQGKLWSTFCTFLRFTASLYHAKLLLSRRVSSTMQGIEMLILTHFFT